MNYTHFSQLGYTIRHSSVSSHPYRLVNPVARHRENYSGLKHSGVRRLHSVSSIDYDESGDQTSFLNFLQGHPIAFVWFHADWCGHCVAMKDEYEQAAEELSGKVSFIKINADKFPQLCKLYNVESYPTLKLFKNGQEVEDYEGKRTATNFVNWLNSKLQRQ